MNAALPDRFSVCLDELWIAEGGFNDIAADRGGATNFGISMRFLAKEVRVNRRARAIVPPPITTNTIRNLTRAQATALYKLCFWDALRAGELPVHIDHAVFCFGVNAGPGRSANFLQRSINLCLRYHEGIAVDGRIGPKTLAAAQLVLERGLVVAFLGHFRGMVRTHYRMITVRDRSQRVFLDGWNNRAAKLGTV